MSSAGGHARRRDLMIVWVKNSVLVASSSEIMVRVNTWPPSVERLRTPSFVGAAGPHVAHAPGPHEEVVLAWQFAQQFLGLVAVHAHLVPWRQRDARLGAFGCALESAHRPLSTAATATTAATLRTPDPRCTPTLSARNALNHSSARAEPHLLEAFVERAELEGKLSPLLHVDAAVLVEVCIMCRRQR